MARTAIRAQHLEQYLTEFEKQAQDYLISAFRQHNVFKVWVVMQVVYSKALDDELQESTLQLSAK